MTTTKTTNDKGETMSLLYTDDTNAEIEIVETTTPDGSKTHWNVWNTRTNELLASKTTQRAARAFAETKANARVWKIYER